MPEGIPLEVEPLVDENTPVLGLLKPDVGGSVDTWGPKLNGNCDILDGLFTDPAKKMLKLANGGTGADTAAGARAALGLGTMATQADLSVAAGAFVRKNPGTASWAALVWADVGGKPVSFPPDAHTHPTSEVTGLDAALAALDADITTLEGQVATKANLSDLPIIVKREVTASGDVLLADAGKILASTAAGAVVLTIQPDATTNIAVGTRIDLTQEGAGALSIAPGAGVTLNSFEGSRKLAGQYAGATLYKYAANSWRLYGAIIA